MNGEKNMAQKSYGKYDLTQHLLVRIYDDFINKIIYCAWVNEEYIEYLVNDKDYNIRVRSDRRTYVSVDRLNYKGELNNDVGIQTISEIYSWENTKNKENKERLF